MTEEKICKNNDPFVFVHRDCATHGRVKRWMCEDCVFDQTKKHEEEIFQLRKLHEAEKGRILSITKQYTQADVDEMIDEVDKIHIAEKKAIFEEMRKLIYCVHSVESIDGGYKAWYDKWQTLKKKFIGEELA